MSRIRKGQNRLFINIGFLIVFLIGLLIALYPTISSRWNSYRNFRLISEYREDIKTDDRQNIYDKLIDQAREYNQRLYVPSVPDAFSIRDGIRDQEYESLLNVHEDGMMGYVEIPVIKVELPVYHYTTEEVLRQGAGHLLGSALPVGGNRSHCVISAHRGLPNAVMFTDLNLVEEGDRFYFHVLNQTLAYEVDQILEVLPTEVESLSAVNGKDYATLITCTPYGVNTHRLLVRGHRIEYSEAVHVEDQTVSERRDPNRLLYQVLSVIAGLAISGIIITIQAVIGRRKKKRSGGPDLKNYREDGKEE